MLKKILFFPFLLFIGNVNAQVYHHANAEIVHEFPGTTIASELFPIGNNLIYLRVLPSERGELWVSDGTTTQLLSDTIAALHRQISTDAWQGLANIGNTFYLAPGIRTSFANQIETEPFVTDGTINGTHPLVDLNPNTSTQAKSSDPSAFISFDNSVLFYANVDRYALYMHDGISSPVMIKNDFLISESIIYNNALYMAASSNNGSIKGLFKMATAQSTPELIGEFPGIKNLQVLGDMLIFVGNKDAGIGAELYKYEESTGDFSLIKDLIPGSSSPIWSGPAHRKMMTGTESIFVVQGNHAFFQIQDPNTSLYKIYRTDGSSTGTIPIFESDSYVDAPHAAKDNIVFYAKDPVSGKIGLMTTDGVSTPTLLKNGGNSFYHGSYVSTNGTYVYGHSREWITTGKAFGLENTSQSTECLIISDGTDEGTKLVKVNFPTNSGGVSYISGGWFSIIDDYLYFLSMNILFKVNLNSISTTGISEFENQFVESIRIFPNPLENRILHVEMESWEGFAELIISDNIGRNIFQDKMKFNTGKGKVVLPELSPGIYFATFSKNGKEFLKKLVITK